MSVSQLYLPALTCVFIGSVNARYELRYDILDLISYCLDDQKFVEKDSELA